MSQASQVFDNEIALGRRYSFGKNWARFLEVLSEERIAAAERSLQSMLEVDRLEGRTFLDVGSGSGLFSLAARRLGATVTSFDFDSDSVACTETLRKRFYPDDDRWTVLSGSVLDPEFMGQLSRYDIVYSWGVLHHTGRMYDAIAAALDRVSPGQLLFIALYRKTWLCPLWRLEKRAYVAAPPWVQHGMRVTYGATFNLAYRVTHQGRTLPRGMDPARDIDDWLGGLPYESITPRELKSFTASRGFSLVKQVIKSEGIHLVHGCDQFLLRRSK